jgi:type VI protein secretion system component VasK
VIHGFGTGTDTPVSWVLALTALCVLVVVVLTLWRLTLSWPQRPGWVTAGIVFVVLAVLAGGAWLHAGPLAPNWSSRSGTHFTQSRAASGTPAGARK